jgi:hypothetical protein
VCRIERVRKIGARESLEVVHAVTSLPRARATAADLLKLSRDHWGIENRLHCVRDVTFREDQCRVRKGSGPQVFAAIRNAAITLLRHLGFTNVVEGIEHFQDERAQAVTLVRCGTIE